MTGHLRDANAELLEWGRTLEKKVEERTQELREIQAHLVQSEKLASIGKLAAGIAHEINNPLGGIVMYSHMLREDLVKEENRENAEKIAKEADRCKRIVKGLLDFARQTKPERSESNLNHVLDEVIALLEHQAIFHNITIVKHQSPELPLIDIDVAQIQEVFMNIILNAAQAMDGKGTLTTMTRLSADRRAVEVEIRDTGPGIRPEHIDKIFEPFFTTKEVGRGTGLGLAIAYGIVERHHGSIRAESELGKGTTFFIRLPLPDDQPMM
jgi:two-component system, NtrC family, sensor kinase